MRRLLTLIFLLSFALLSTACSSKPTLYRWGQYEPLVYRMYVLGDESDPASQTAILEEDISRSQAEGKRVAPGVHAHLGFLYYSQGDVPAAREQFLNERKLFPESATFIDGIIKRMDKSSKRGGAR